MSQAIPTAHPGDSPARFVVSVTHSDGFYTAVCEDLCLVTEAKTIDELQNRVWEIAPELVELNNMPVDANFMHLLFDVAPPSRAA
jgi:hypothetical protein